MAAVTFVLPGDARSGGVRVTVIMGNALLDRGHRVRIAAPRPRSVKEYFQQLKCRIWKDAGWLWQFKGPIVRFNDINELDYAEKEIVIAVGTYAVSYVQNLSKPVIKVRYNHGLPALPRKQDVEAWSGTMLTITVSHTVAATLEKRGVGPLWGVVPNGINTGEYYVMEGVKRDGIGAAYNSHPNKAPEDLKAVLSALAREAPHVPIRVFSAERRPRELRSTTYKRLPSIAEAREIYNKSVVWILTSRTEGLPGIVLEAMACGCVVVSSDNDGSREVIRHGQNGILVPCGDRDAFVREALQVLKTPIRAEAMRQCALATVKQFSWDRAVQRMEDFVTYISRTPEKHYVRK